MPTFSDYLEKKILDHTFLGTAFTQPASIFIKLHSGDPGKNGTSNAAGNTTRVACSAFNAASATGGTKTSNAAVQWTNVTPAETYSYISLWDDPSAGNCLGSGQLTAPVPVSVGATFTIASGALTITLA